MEVKQHVHLTTLYTSLLWEGVASSHPYGVFIFTHFYTHICTLDPFIIYVGSLTIPSCLYTAR